MHTLDDVGVNQVADETNANIIELDYCGIDEEYTSNQQCKVLEAYLHNLKDEHQRLTYVREGMRAYTFELPRIKIPNPSIATKKHA